MTREDFYKSCTAPKIQGAFIAAPAWIGITLLMQDDDVAAWIWMNVVTVACIAAVIIAIVIYFAARPPKAIRNVLPRPKHAHAPDSGACDC